MAAGDHAFSKTAPAAALSMFEAEADGLRELAAAKVIRVPEVYSCGIKDGYACIEMEKLTFERPTSASEQQFGEQLAELHRHTQAKHGWHRDNTIGPTAQKNSPSDDWVSFYREQRLSYQLKLADTNGYHGELQVLGAVVLDRLDDMFVDYVPAASLLHGDLWGGNRGVADGVPVIFDPAVYYGDRETDIAMTQLFGSFGRPFYEAYESAWPLAAGYEQRRDLYQLYHVLNHLNLFGSGYLSQATALLQRLQ
jgi:fructosamine-3-kinase